ncbi:hypothetical protein [Mucilaginibacter antarcticus]|uniref:hypothetical protein n=1 Tax=Mucilaginibacter antarcticus TaxID=1855725 RepID=UPI003636A490
MSKTDTLSIWDQTLYDDSGRRVKIIRKLPKALNSLFTYTYNRQNNLVETYYVDEGKAETSHTVYDRAKQRDTFYREGKLNPFKIVRHIDKFHDEEISFYLALATISTDSTLFSIKDNPLEHTSLIAYNQNHQRVSEIVHNSNGQKESHKIYRYDERQNLLGFTDSIWRDARDNRERKLKLAGVNAAAYKYTTFDKPGNWTKRYTLNDAKFVLTARRKLKYYR